MTAPEDDTTDAIDVTSRALLIAYDPRSGRRPDIQRLGPILRGVGLADLLDTGAVADQGDSVQALGDAPASPPMLTLWTDCRNGTSWKAAVSRNGRTVVHDCERVLAGAGLVALTEKGLGPFRSRSARPTPAGEVLAEQWRSELRADLSRETPTPSAAALSLGLQKTHLAKVLGTDIHDTTVGSHLAPGLAAAVRRAAQQRQAMVVG